MEADQDRRDRGESGVRLVELVDELAPVAGGEDEPEAGDAEQHQPRPAPEPDGEGEQERGDDGDDHERDGLGVDAEDLGADLAVALPDVLRALTRPALTARLAARAALGGPAGAGASLGVMLVSLDRGADREQQA